MLSVWLEACSPFSRFKRAAAYYGDAYFQAPRRHMLSSLSYFGVSASWAYMFEQPMPESLGIPSYIGSESVDWSITTSFSSGTESKRDHG